MRIHDLRHTFPSRALALGEGLPMIGKLLGHTQVQTTARWWLVVGEIRRVENHVRVTLKAFGLKTGKTSRRRFVQSNRELVAGTALVEVADGLLQIRRVLLHRLEIYDRKVFEIVRTDAVCRGLTTAPGVGPIVALSYRTAMDTPARFARTRDIGAYFGPTPKRYQSSEVDRSGRIRKVGDETNVENAPGDRAFGPVQATDASSLDLDSHVPSRSSFLGRLQSPFHNFILLRFQMTR